MADGFFDKYGSSIFDGLSAGLKWAGELADARAQEAFQKYRNTMSSLSGAMSQNAITTNEVMTLQSSAETALQLKRQQLLTVAAAEAEAAAAGASGNSVATTLRDIQFNAAQAESRRQQELQDALTGFTQSRKTAAMAIVMQQDNNLITKPSVLSGLFGAVGPSIKDIFKESNNGNRVRAKG